MKLLFSQMTTRTTTKTIDMAFFFFSAVVKTLLLPLSSTPLLLLLLLLLPECWRRKKGLGHLEQGNFPAAANNTVPGLITARK